MNRPFNSSRSLVRTSSGHQKKKTSTKIAILICLTMTFGSNSPVFGQTANIVVDYIGSAGTCGADNTYAATSGSVNFNGGIPANAVVTSIGISANLGKLGGANSNFTFLLNTVTIGSINGVTATCQTNAFTASPLPAYNNTTANTLAFTSTGGTIRGVYNVTVTITYCTPPAAPAVVSPVNLCIGQSASPLTATGTNLLWYTGPSGGTGSPTAPTPSTAVLGSTFYYVSQNTGCEGPRAQINAIVNGKPVASVSSTVNVTCFGDSDGKITVLASGGTGPYTYSKNGSNPSPTWVTPTPVNATSHQFTGLSGNTPYRIKVKDNFNCISK